MDVDEYLNMLFDKLETATQKTDQASVLRDNFGGKVVNQIICKVKHKRTILESLDAFVEGEVLEGDNKYFCEEANQKGDIKYFCEKANQKVDALKRACVKTLPRTLILHLKRFEFDFDYMKKVKVNDSCEFPMLLKMEPYTLLRVNDSCEFPMLLNMEPYTLAGIERREAIMAEAKSAGLDEAEAAERLARQADPDSEGGAREADPDSEYQLVGVLVHRGTADSGHYFRF
ncbi:hypothetical protein T484DRAFT_1814535 [Baffinella frigidus]|nr:hypothetical protein T484DRAFT_1814535 [Cryptophyta sp. CCMP2293]